MRRDEPTHQPPQLNNAKIISENSEYINTVKLNVI